MVVVGPSEAPTEYLPGTTPLPGQWTAHHSGAGSGRHRRHHHHREEERRSPPQGDLLPHLRRGALHRWQARVQERLAGQPAANPRFHPPSQAWCDRRPRSVAEPIRDTGGAWRHPLQDAHRELGHRPRPRPRRPRPLGRELTAGPVHAIARRRAAGELGAAPRLDPSSRAGHGCHHLGEERWRGTVSAARSDRVSLPADPGKRLKPRSGRDRCNSGELDDQSFSQRSNDFPRQ